MTQGPQGAPGEGGPGAGGPEGGDASGPDEQAGPMLAEGQEAAQAGDTGDDEAEADDGQGSGQQADNAALAKQMVGEMAGQFGKAMAGDAFGSVIPEVWRIEA